MVEECLVAEEEIVIQRQVKVLARVMVVEADGVEDEIGNKIMPKGLVKTKRDEKMWNRAKAATRKQYPYISEDSDRFYKITMTIYKNMTGKKPEA